MKLFRLPKQYVNSDELEQASHLLNLDTPTLLKYQREFEQQVNSKSVRDCLAKAVEPFCEIFTESIVCGFIPDGEEWAVCFTSTSVASVNMSSCGTPYVLINLNLFLNISFNERLLVLAHENVHLKQIEKGRQGEIVN
ncbi:hypothetical protein AB4565_17560, partial [Vibrio breoganii]